jgi:hypothetical protein
MTLPSQEFDDSKASDLSMLNITDLRNRCMKIAKQSTVPLFQMDNRELYINFLDAFIVTQALMGPYFKSSDQSGNPDHAHNMLRQVIDKDILRLSPAACMAAWLTLDEFRWHNHIPFINDAKYPNGPGIDYSYGLIGDPSLHRPLKSGLSFFTSDDDTIRELKRKHYNTEGCQVFALNKFRALRTISYEEECRLIPPTIS